MDWKTMLAYMTGSVDEELLRRNEYLAAENRILSVSNSLSGRHWELNQAPAVGNPTDIVQFGTGHLRWPRKIGQVVKVYSSG